MCQPTTHLPPPSVTSSSTTAPTLPTNSLFMMDSTVPMQKRSSFAAAGKKRPLNNTNNSNNKSVAFAPMVTVTETYRVTPAEATMIWYSPSDLSSFKASARAVARAHQHQDSDDGASSSSSITRRGLETCSFERQKQRHMAIKCTLSAYRRGMTLEQTAAVSQTCSGWVTRQAFVVACHDFAEIYQPALLDAIPAVELTPPAFPFGFKNGNGGGNKRSSASAAVAATSIEQPRNVRQRVC